MENYFIWDANRIPAYHICTNYTKNPDLNTTVFRTFGGPPRDKTRRPDYSNFSRDKSDILRQFKKNVTDAPICVCGICGARNYYDPDHMKKHPSQYSVPLYDKWTGKAVKQQDPPGRRMGKSFFLRYPKTKRAAR